MDWSVISSSIPVYGEAALLTLRIGVIGIIASALVGLLCAAVQSFRIPVLRQIVAVYIELSRNTPLLVQLFFLYFGLPKVGVVWPSEVCAIVGLTFLGGSYMAEAFRSGLDSVHPIQLQSALALGMSTPTAFRHVLAPQAFAIAAPALTANVIFLIKETSVVSVVALPDLVYVAKEQIGTDYDTSEALLLLVAFYLLLLLPISLGANWLERKVRSNAFGS
ncbi:His/Glu/Gln/Arg/opine family amino ABC transporter, permease, 3-TM region [Propionibacterium sp. oral taxon 192 str. F0372]|uniref:amino acid ABC transporter permease n=1 Tax=Propionibacterium sp. oral taxon 192 TaxID=671222 RepID=UPI000353F34A|nr:amino acid ABC transporter permease [Propionibacterium sp. oral taxon 192]EPH05523.1 His/Glu/Gln/Arg/opine family amino ABC transporter, permease, 3-TM region [Propionibacterium sp. oral taxon 192 str. F0372]